MSRVYRAFDRETKPDGVMKVYDIVKVMTNGQFGTPARCPGDMQIDETVTICYIPCSKPMRSEQRKAGHCFCRRRRTRKSSPGLCQICQRAIAGHSSDNRQNRSPFLRRRPDTGAHCR